ncbi:MAG TPA: DedA family protein [Jatrophihabitans sp.]|jgi:undecaprenyl-diphosphatase|uniref:DedA family protein n=1 Tax=Jatrophihabitans sp. TaxID=1932789 RepID=UPI002E0870EB|nr:DedA family protein [Jatrophihabitans sp.]
MGHILDGILRLPAALALTLVFLLPALEASAFVGVIIPGEIGVILGGVLANQHKLPLLAVGLAGVAGAVIGDSIGYWVGLRYGAALLSKIPNRVLKPEHITAAEDSIRRFGGKSVFIGRFTAALRALIPGLAGMSRLPYPRFLAWNALGGLLWAVGFTVLGYLAGSQYARIEHYANYLGLALLVLIAVALIVRHRRRSRKKGASPPVPR